MDFQDSNHGGHPGISTEPILAIFDIQVNLVLSTKFRGNWPFGSGEAMAAILDF